MFHQFNEELACEYGIECAVIVHNIAYWVIKNQANNKHLYDGRSWTYNSREAFLKLFPYLKNVDKVGRLLRKLESDGVIESAIFNDNRYNQTKWYTIKSERVMQLYNIENAKMHDGQFKNAPSSMQACKIAR